MAAIVYVTATGEVIGGYPDLSRANTVAATNSAWSSADLSADLPEWFFPGSHWNGTTLSQEPPQGTTVDDLKGAAAKAHEQLLVWATGLDTLTPFEPASVVAKGHDWLAWAHYGLNMVCRSTTWTTERRIKFATHLAYGALDITSPEIFFSSAADLTAPTGPVVWVDPRTTNADRVNLSEAIALTAAIASDMASQPSATSLVGGAWIADLTA